MEVTDLFKTVSVTWKKLTLVLRRPSLETEGFYKEYLERSAIAAVARYRDVFGELGYRDAVQAVTRDFATRTYAWGRPVTAESLADEENFKRFLWFIVRQRVKGQQNPNADLDWETFEQIWADKSGELQDAWLEVSRPVDPTKTPASPAQDPEVESSALPISAVS